MVLFLLPLTAAAADVLPVHRIRFYETGVAWFERSGTVTDETTLPVPTSHLDDALKSLVVLGGDVEVGAITFPSAIADDAAMTEAGLLDMPSAGFEEVLRTLLGRTVRIELDGAPPLTGTLLDVLALAVEEEAPPGPTPYALTLLGDDGALLRLPTDRITAVHSEDDVTGRLRRAAQTLGPTVAQRQAAIDLQLWRGGSVQLGYVAEAPVWQVTYRVVTDGGAQARLQAWAIVHNDTEEDWKQVKLELANGEPDSFVNPLVAPRYAEREVRLPEDGLSTVAQLASVTPDQLSAGGYGTSGIGYGGGGYGSASGAGGVGTMGVVTHALAELKQAEPVETPTQFVYRVGRPIDLAARHSALVPLVHQDVAVEQLVAFLPDSLEGRTGLWLSNSTDRTLPDGIVSVLDSGGLAGEGQLERLKPEESQMLLFGNELDVDVERAETPLPPVPVAVHWDEGLQVTSVLATDHTTSVRNRSGEQRMLWFALSLDPETEVVGEWRSVIDPHHGYTWVVVQAEPGSTTHELRVELREEQERDIASVSTLELRSWAKDKLGDPGPLRTAADRRAEVDEIEAALAELQAELSRAQGEVEGLRLDLQASLGSDQNDPLSKRAASVEQECRRLAERIATAETERDAALALVEEALQRMSPGLK